ncbi:hypothetical protein G6031_03205 [Dietzia sp. CQ4]|uniref:hypothetical protein n=1 Tax=Dietzia sp. (strain CQ4) TaxID=370437 RepID=UPI0015FCB32C|nr:hypothetical protein [Dietzia sp. CQ4]MBB1033398.1 hypothetical protein [Dietzia sp. CQ4]
MDLDLLYPYETSPEFHPLSWVFFHAGGVQMDIGQCDALARHVFGQLGCDGPGSAAEPVIKYDSFGSGGAPWEQGAWIPREKRRRPVRTTMPDKPVTEMDEDEFVEAQQAIVIGAAVRRAQAADAADDYTPPKDGDTGGR